MRLNNNLSELEIIILGGPFGVFQYELHNQLFAITSVLEDTEMILEERKSELKKKYDVEMLKVDWTQYEYTNDYVSSYQEEFESRHITVYQALYNSSFLHTFSLFEISLRILYKHLLKSKGNKDTLNWKSDYAVSSPKIRTIC
jgi:hypothetical protein